MSEQLELSILWNKMLGNLKRKTELPTIPKNREPIWFTAVSDGNCIYVSKAKDHMPSSQISIERKLRYKEFERIYPVYLKREAGMAVSEEACRLTHNQVYWFSIIHHCGIKII